MSLVDESPVNSSSSDDFAAFLDAELDSTSDTNPQQEEEKQESDDDSDDNDDDEINAVIESEPFARVLGFKKREAILKTLQHVRISQRTKRRKIIVVDDTEEPNGSTSHIVQTEVTETSVKEDICIHPGFIGGMCIKCGEKTDDDTQSSVAFGYIHKDLRLANDEIARLRDRDLKNLLRHKKLYLVLDLDHTLLNSTRFSDLAQDEGYLLNPNDPMQDALKGSLFKLPFMNMVTKLRPFVHTFLKEASNYFEMYIYTMGERAYALEMANLLDPGRVYFDSKVIAQGDCTQRHQKGLDVVLGQENAVLILDDTEQVWSKHKDNLISMERYHFFASSCKQFGYKSKSLSELRSDESDTDGALATVLKVLKRVHSMFYDSELGENFAGRDARQMLRAVRSEVLKGCKIVFSRVFPTKFQADNHHLWMLAERLGATCSTEVDSSVTHVISTDIGTEKSRWAIQENKFLVEPRWLEAANFLWQRLPEESFPVKDVKVNH
ncbi:RNA polymerase II C-terminal domain phosphatase-like 4 isoform X1 [Helianthus annuus]|uniref:RNA polymerase II C-terminal domain phosphatase-like 4 isoform X1 n=1 Tax=Helianthus annuus TaxID=4232 RepID=UPI001652CE50|nr:RNA polymerase II C-terminal domain phosphatase-like 4 isoform X1 [Helianthus annuus]XP_035832339.1 RNA polymerase II C-terminal domain phosphatase-like 4 isoform X1 [Helianthus annuus]XP_035832340.1 RNA polymerase II C-terminal domain phosphatase-like 4 isoform X1 [Helianthus annuus]XP_035832341.1 RNA polymerase II C-terminal domain phosphatase-like 4 isoform X1 [Helianthus annuus]XP_035832342.1 RNA polymerase II C-terminal domain phosphatase-like 4 isoform X1 [Helianthus annuus]XP_0358323